jgi:hypothetical protein
MPLKVKLAFYDVVCEKDGTLESSSASVAELAKKEITARVDFDIEEAEELYELLKNGDSPVFRITEAK